MSERKIIKFGSEKDPRGVDYQKWTQEVELEVVKFPSAFKKDICQGFGCRIKLGSNKKDLVLKISKTNEFMCYQCSKFLLSNRWGMINVEIHNLPDLEIIRKELRKWIT